MEHLPFGAFNPRFYGISLILAKQDRIDAVGRYDRAEDLAEWLRETGTSPLEQVLALSAVDHEARHFHDFLVSPLGTITMGLRMQASVNGVQAMKVLKRCRGRYVPAPLRQWIQWNDTERERWIESTGQFFGIERLEEMVDLPRVPDATHVGLQAGAHEVDSALSPEQELSTYVGPAVQAYLSMQELRQHQDLGFDMNVSSDSVFEALAHLVQMQAVWTGQGESAAQTFHEFVLRSPAEYLLPLQVLWAALKHCSRPVGIRRMTEMCTWMLLGPWERLASGVHPAHRYLQVLMLAVASPNHEVFADAMSSERVFDRLDELTESSPWRSNITSASSAADRRREFYLRVSKTLNGGYFDALFAVASAWHQDQRSARRTFLSDPESLVDPLRYVTERVYPIPFIETRLGSMVHERTEPLISASARAIVVDAEGKRVLSYIAKVDSGQTEECLDNIVASRLVTHLVDFLFLDEPVLDVYENYWRSRVESYVGKKIVSVY